jgi:copper chaperone CopZ
VAAVLFCAQNTVAHEAVGVSDNAKSGQPVPLAKIGEAKTTIAVKVKGSMCAACLKHLQSALSAIVGVQSVNIEADAFKPANQNETAKTKRSRHDAVYVISFDGAQISRSEIEGFIRRRDFRISTVRVLAR